MGPKWSSTGQWEWTIPCPMIALSPFTISVSHHNHRSKVETLINLRTPSTRLFAWNSKAVEYILFYITCIVKGKVNANTETIPQRLVTFFNNKQRNKTNKKPNTLLSTRISIHSDSKNSSMLVWYDRSMSKYFTIDNLVYVLKIVLIKTVTFKYYKLKN